jgi:N-glycosylase/DNA lyase
MTRELREGYAPAVIHAPLFHLRKTIESGQVFYWHPVKPSVLEGARAREQLACSSAYCGLIGSTPVRIEQHGEFLHVTPGTEAVVRQYFALDHPLEEIYATFPADLFMATALEACRGIRILRQPLFECLGTFITSSMKQVKHIQQMSRAIRERFGTRIEHPEAQGFHESPPLFAYPTPEQLANATESQLRECGLGFRAKSLLGTARAIAAGEVNLEAIRQLPDADALSELCQLPGVGAKIANCVLLFGYERVKAFPIDVWIERVLRQRYFAKRRKVTTKRLEEFAATHFGPYGGYAQQYLFHHARTLPRADWKG